MDIRQVSFDDRPLTTCNPVFAVQNCTAGGTDPVVKSGSVLQQRTLQQCRVASRRFSPESIYQEGVAGTISRVARPFRFPVQVQYI